MSRVKIASPMTALEAATPVPVSAQAAALLDDPHEWSRFGRPVPSASAEALWESQIVLQGMHCAACALTIEQALCAVPGVAQAQVSAAAQRARVVWRSNEVLPSQWMAAVEPAGYRALPAMDAQVRDARQAERRTMLWRWLVAGFCMMQVMMYAWPAYVAQPGDLSLEMETLLRWASWVICVPVLLFACGPFFSSALRDIRQRRISMDLPVALGMLVTFAVSTAGTFDPTGRFGREVYFDSLTMFVFFLLTGRWWELRLRERTAGALEAVLNRLPDSIERLQADGSFSRVAIHRLAVGDTVRVRPGEAFPADGCIVQGSTQVDEAVLTGESTPLTRGPGAAVIAGSYNLHAPVTVQVQALGNDTRFAHIVALMESAALQKPRLAQLADRIARPFLFGILVAAALAAAWWWPSDPSRALMVAVAVLIVTCPCALSLATPVAMLAAAGALARRAVLVRNLQAFEALAQVDTVVFDKTGTLTRDALTVQGIHPAANAGVEAEQALAWAAALGRHSLHPVSRALVSAYEQRQAQGQGLAPTPPIYREVEIAHIEERLGQGLQATLSDGRIWRLGAPAADLHTAAPQPQVVLSQEQDGQVRELARFDLHEDLRPEAAQVVQQLQRSGIQVWLLSGDRAAPVQRVAQACAITHAYAQCTPDDKLQRMQAAQAAGRRIAMVGDGLNDGPVLAGADVSFAFGQAVALAQSRADFVVLGDQLPLVAHTLFLARRTLRVVRQNLWWAAGYNAVTVPLAVVGWMPAWLAGLGMAASSLLVVLNAARLSRLPSVNNDSKSKNNNTGAHIIPPAWEIA